MKVGVDVRCLADGELRGFARYTAELLWGLAHVSGIDLLGFADRPVAMPPSLAALDVAVLSGGAARFEGREWHREQVALPRLLRNHGVDVVLGPANRGLALAGPPSVLTVHDAVEWDRDLVEQPTGRSRVRFAYSNVVSLASATRIITVSQHSARELDRVLGLGCERVRVISEAPGRAFAELATDTERHAMRQALDLCGPYVLYLGGFDDKKSVDTLVRAWARLDPTTTPGLVLAGSGGDAAARFGRMVDDIGGESSRLRCLGFVDDQLLPSLYAEADLFVFPAVAEGFGLPPVEAMAAGTATVIADAGSLPEATRGAAVACRPRDVAHLAQVMRWLLDDDNERRRLGAVGRSAVMERSWIDVAADTAEVLFEAAAVGRSTRWSASARSVRHAHRWVR